MAGRLTRTRPDMKVLYLTGYTDDIVLQQGRLRDNTSVLNKPCLLETLLRKVRELLDVRKPPSA